MTHDDISRAIFEALESALRTPGERRTRPARGTRSRGMRMSMQDVQIARIVLEPAKPKRRKLR